MHRVGSGCLRGRDDRLGVQIVGGLRQPDPGVGLGDMRCRGIGSV